MALETAPFIDGLVPANPPGSDRVHQGDDHIRLIKQALQNTFPNITGAVTLTQDEINAVPTAPYVPIGFIGLWYGAADDVPDGYAICDGSTVTRTDGEGDITTPDLRGRVAVGLEAPKTVGQTFGGDTAAGGSTDAGGAHTHTGTATSAGEHDHGAATGSTTITGHLSTTTDPVDGSGGFPVVTSVSLSGLGAHTHTISPGGGHTHTISINEAGSHTHNLGSIPIVQRSMALHYIMKH